jgi:hypothetical protein
MALVRVRRLLQGVCMQPFIEKCYAWTGSPNALCVSLVRLYSQTGERRCSLVLVKRFGMTSQQEGVSLSSGRLDSQGPCDP